MKLTSEQIEAIKNCFEACFEAWRKIRLIMKKICNELRRFWTEIRLALLKVPEGRKILMEIITNNTWRRMHGLPLIRRC